MMIQTIAHHLIGGFGCLGSIVCGHQVLSVCVSRSEIFLMSLAFIDGELDIRSFHALSQHPRPYAGP